MVGLQPCTRYRCRFDNSDRTAVSMQAAHVTPDYLRHSLSPIPEWIQKTCFKIEVSEWVLGFIRGENNRVLRTNGQPLCTRMRALARAAAMPLRQTVNGTVNYNKPAY